MINLLIYNLIFAMLNILLFQYNQWNQTTNDPNELLDEINEIIENTEDEKSKEAITNIVEMALNNPQRFKVIIYLLSFVPIVNAMLIGINLNMIVKD